MPAFLSQYIINELKAIDTIIYEAIDGCKTVMSNFLFPLERYKYMEIKNMRILLSMFKDDARKDNKVRINCFQLVTKKKYGYIKRIIAQCKYCSAKLQYKGIKT